MKNYLFSLVLLLLASCGFEKSLLKVNLSRVKSNSIVGGVVTPFIGSIASYHQSGVIIESAMAAACADPVFAKLYSINTDGSIDDDNPLATQKLSSNARYSFDLKTYGLGELNNKVQFIVKAEGCNGDSYKRPVTNTDTLQDINASTTVVAEVVNAHSLVSTTLNETKRSDVEVLIKSLSATTLPSAIDALQNNAVTSTKFTEIFGASPEIITDAKPEVKLTTPVSNVNELSSASFRVSTSHPDPAYSMAYSWKLDGVVKASSFSWNWTPGANDSGLHQISVYVGKNNGSGNIDLTKPYYVKTFEVAVNNNSLPVAPVIALHSTTPSPRNTNQILLDITTGAGFINCQSFSHLAITTTSAAPNSSQFILDCNQNGTQTENVTFPGGDGTKTIYLWAIDSDGVVSAPKSVSLILDTLPPTASVSFAQSLVKGGSTHTINLGGSDAGVGLQSLRLYYSATGTSPFTLISNLALTDTSYNWTAPFTNTTGSKFQLIATDLTGSTTTVESAAFDIDSTSPSNPVISRTSSSSSNSRDVVISVTCTADYNKIYFSESSSIPAENHLSWENCQTAKTFNVSAVNGLKTIYAFTKDAAGNISSSSNVTMTLDTTAPGTPAVTLASALISNSSTVAFTITDCLDRPHVLVSESMTAPASSDSGWQVCSTANAAVTSTLTGPVLQGNHNLYVYAKDSVGNVSLPAMASMVYDTVNPALTLSTTIASLYKGGDVINLAFSASDTNGLSALTLEYAADGVTWATAATLATTATAYNWTVPANNTTSAKIRLMAKDNALSVNTATAASTAFTIDSTNPSNLSLSRTSNQYSTSSTVTMSLASCTDADYVLIKEGSTVPAVTDAGWTTCSTVAGNYSRTVSGEGTHTFYAWAKDLAGNISATASSVSMNLDTLQPAIVTGPLIATAITGGTNHNITWNVTDANTLTIKLEYFNGTSWSNIATALTNNGTYSWNAPSADIDNARIRLTATDLASNSSTATSADITIDSTPPVVDLISLNSGATTTNNNNVDVRLTAHDSLSKIKYFCLKYDDNTKPASADSCWKDVTAPSPGITASKNITFSGYYFQIGFTKSSKTVYAWVKDESGQISDNSATTGTDRASIYFDPGTPPVLSAIQVTNSDSPNNPVTSADMTATTAGYIYVKWNASDLEGLATNPITINYTTNETTYNTIAIATNIPNAVNGSCTIDASFTGCIRIPTPVNGFFKIRVIAKDTLDTTVFLNSAAMNDLKVKILAGNTEDGINGSATSAVYNMYGSSKNVSHIYKHKLVVTDDGKIFYLDKVRGLLWIDPSNGILKKFISTTGAYTGDGGPVASAGLYLPLAIAYDYKNNLLIWDNVRIRKVNLTTMTISNLIGGGTTSDPSTTVNASDIQLAAFSPIYMSLIPLPNGDIIFTSNNGSLHDRKFRAVDNKVELIDLQGAGFTDYPTDSWTTTTKTDIAVEFDTTTSAINFMMKGFMKVFTGDSKPFYSRIDHTVGNETTPYPGIGPYNIPVLTSEVITGMDGKIYSIDRFRNIVHRYNSTTNLRTVVLGTGVAGSAPCAENTLASSCKVDVDSIFVAKNSRIYFTDNGTIRTIDDAGKVVTIAGQYPSYGNGTMASVARFGNIQDLHFGKTSASENKIIVEDIFSDEFREFTINGNISSLAAVNYSYNGPMRFEVERSTGDIISPNNSGYVRRFSRTTSTWSNIAGGGTNLYRDNAVSEGKTGSTINFEYSYAGAILGLVNDNFFYHKFSYVSGTGTIGCHIKSFDMLDSYRMTHLMGAAGCAGGAIPEGSATKDNSLATANMSNIEYFQDPADSVNKYFFAQLAGNKIYSTTSPNGANTLFATLTHAMYAFTHNTDANGLNLFYCSTSGLLYKYNVSTSTTTNLSWLSPTFKCKATARSILYNSTRNSIIFAFTQNGLDGVAEYDLN